MKIPIHPGEAILAQEQWRNRVLREISTQDQGRALVLRRELQAMQAAGRAMRPHD